MQVPGVPLIFGLRNALFLEPPSAFQREFVKVSEEGRSHMTESEYKMLKKRANNLLETEGTRNSSNENDDLEDQRLETQTVKQEHNTTKGLGMKDGPQFKRKKAKVKNFAHFLYLKLLIECDWFIIQL